MDGDNWDVTTPFSTVSDCMVGIADNYYANVCGGENGSDFANYSTKQPGALTRDLIYARSPWDVLIDFGVNVSTSFFGNAKNYRLAWKIATQNVLESAESTSTSYLTPESFNQVLAGDISAASDLNREIGGEMEITVISNLYAKRTGLDVTPAMTWQQAERFALVIHPAGTDKYRAVYIMNFYYEDAMNMIFGSHSNPWE
jgi:hypothetical protein